MESRISERGFSVVRNSEQREETIHAFAPAAATQREKTELDGPLDLADFCACNTEGWLSPV